MPQLPEITAEDRLRQPVARSFARFACVATCALVVLATLLAHAVLLPAGHWQDEYKTFPIFWEHGWRGWWGRIVLWSPRPLSETLLFLYAQSVRLAGEPLIGPSLAFGWGLLASAATAGIWCVRGRRRIEVALVGLSVPCLLLAQPRIAEFFYWPQSALAYLPATAGVLVAAWIVIFSDVHSRTGRWLLAVSLTAAAASAEVAAVLVIAFAACLLLVRQWRAWVVAPVAMSLLVLAMTSSTRLGAAGEIFGDPRIAHHVFAAASAATWAFARETFGTASLPKVLFLAGTWLVLRRTPGHVMNLRVVLALAFACFAAMFISIAAAYYQFGVLCCDRHETWRQALCWVGLLLCAAAAAHRLPSNPMGIDVGLLLVAAAVAWSVSLRVPAVLADWRGMAARVAVNEANWEAGRQNADDMVFRTLPPGKVVGGLALPEGRFRAGEGPDSVPALVAFFGKRQVNFVPALTR